MDKVGRRSAFGYGDSDNDITDDGTWAAEGLVEIGMDSSFVFEDAGGRNVGGKFVVVEGYGGESSKLG